MAGQQQSGVAAKSRLGQDRVAHTSQQGHIGNNVGATGRAFKRVQSHTAPPVQQAEEGEGGYSLGGSLWCFTPADGCAVPKGHAPETWLAGFADHADGEVYTGLSHLGKPGLDYALVNARSATVSLDPTRDSSCEAWEQRLGRVMQQVNTRLAAADRLVRLQTASESDGEAVRLQTFAEVHCKQPRGQAVRADRASAGERA